MFGHEEAECKKGLPRPQWGKKTSGGQDNNAQYQQVGEHRPGKEVANVDLNQNNTFDMLVEDEMDEEGHDLGTEGIIPVYETGSASAGRGNDTMDMQNAAGGIPPNANG